MRVLLSDLLLRLERWIALRVTCGQKVGEWCAWCGQKRGAACNICGDRKAGQ